MLGERYAFLEQHEAVLENEIAEIETALAYRRYKKWSYMTAQAAGTENIHFEPGTHEVNGTTAAEYQAYLTAKSQNS